MHTESSYPETAILIDADFLDYITYDFKRNFSRILNRELRDIDLSELLSYMALDGGIQKNESQEIGVMFIYDHSCPTFSICHPASLKKELNGVAFKNELGEFCVSSFSTEGLTSVEEMFLDALQSLASSNDVKKLLVVGFNEHYGEKIVEILKSATGKNIIQFRMDEPSEKLPFHTEIIAYPIMGSLGIKSEELA